MNAAINTIPAQQTKSDLLIDIVDIHKSYFSADVETPVLHGINVKIQHGEFVAIMGSPDPVNRP